MIELDLDPWQLEVIKSPARIKTVMAGRGSGKTVGIARNQIIMDGLTKINHETAYFAPSYAVGKRECKAIAKNRFLMPYIERAEDQPFPRIVWNTGSQSYFRSADRDDNLLGYHLNRAIVDEVHKIGERMIHEVIRPQLGAKRGELLMMGQHDEDGEEGWINLQFFLPGQRPGQTDFASWRIPSSAGRQYQGASGRAEFEMLRKSTPDYSWRWQYLAEAVESQNKAFRPEDIKKCILGDEQSESLGTQCVIGYDIGKVTDPSAEVVLGVVDASRCRVLGARLHRLGEPHEQQALALQRLSRVFGEPTVIVDVTGGGQGAVRPGQEVDACTKYYREMVPGMRGFNINQHTKAQIVQDVQLLIEQGRVTIPATCVDLIRQLKSYRWERRSAGTLDFHGPNGHDDDLVMALALAVTGFVRKWYGGQGGSPLSSLM